MSLKQIIKHLHELNVLHLELIRLGKQKQDVIIANNVDELSKLVQSEGKLAKTIGMIEQQRIEAVKNYQQVNGLPQNEDISIDELIEQTNDPVMKQQLLEISKSLTETFEDLKDLNKLNESLIQQSLDFIQFNIELITGAEQDVVYQNPGQKSKVSNRQGIFDYRA